ncbi:hypothetical protein E2C01_066541 [Portunus trituberculatus]|uniref:Uncharacterized protein n=1 Tax=Portunus trituberculatus TaxID=210409 RepID=A0A5B7HQ21_PORTR|nr:hypothetical protein [Portunus trituberculatus]
MLRKNAQFMTRQGAVGCCYVLACFTQVPLRVGTDDPVCTCGVQYKERFADPRVYSGYRITINPTNVEC